MSDLQTSLKALLNLLVMTYFPVNGYGKHSCCYRAASEVLFQKEAESIFTAWDLAGRTRVFNRSPRARQEAKEGESGLHADEQLRFVRGAHSKMDVKPQSRPLRQTEQTTHVQNKRHVLRQRQRRPAGK